MAIFVVDKKPGFLSTETAQQCCPDAGHAGTLDRQASGLLLVFCGEARKLIPLAVGLDKEYEGVIHIHQPVPEKQLKAAIKQFTGEITQTPPVKAAVARRPRKRNVYSFQLLSLAGKDARFRLSCQAGTYVRKIASDLGLALGVGAHLKALRRTRIGPFSLADCGELTPEEFVSRLPVGKVWVKKEAVGKVMVGAPLEKRDREEQLPGDPVVLFFQKNVIGLGKRKGERVFVDRLIR